MPSTTPSRSGVLDGLAEELDAAGRSMLLVAHGGGPRARRRPARHPGRRRRGLPLCGTAINPHRRPPPGPGIPLVGGGAPVHPRRSRPHRRERRDGPGPGTSGIGHTRMAHLPCLSGPCPRRGVTTRTSHSGLPRRRRSGWGSGRSPAHAPIVQANDLTVEAGEAAARPLLDVPRRPPTAGSWRRLTCSLPERSAPRSRSGSGCPRSHRDRFDGETSVAGPRVTTVEQPGADKGRRMGRLVPSCPEGPPGGGRAVRLRVGTTSSSPPSPTGLTRVSGSGSAAPRPRPRCRGCGQAPSRARPRGGRRRWCATRRPTSSSSASAVPEAWVPEWMSNVPAASTSTCIEPARL